MIKPYKYRHTFIILNLQYIFEKRGPNGKITKQIVN